MVARRSSTWKIPAELCSSISIFTGLVSPAEILTSSIAAAEIERDAKIAEAEIVIDATKATQELEQEDIRTAAEIRRDRDRDGFGESRATRQEIVKRRREEERMRFEQDMRRREAGAEE